MLDGEKYGLVWWMILLVFHQWKIKFMKMILQGEGFEDVQAYDIN